MLVKDSERDGEINADEYGDNFKLKVAYNDVKLLALRKKEIRRLKKKIIDIKNKFKIEKKKIEVRPHITFKGIKTLRKKEKRKLRDNKDLNIDDINKKIKEIEAMNIVQYLEHIKEGKKKILKLKMEKKKKN